tara:strand:- start:2351 stop:3403 length:1053 start_codon:yes stop_codon:yes gene_type:complete
MKVLTPSITIDGRDIDFIDGALTSTGGLTAASLQFKLPLTVGGNMTLWNKEVILYFNEFEGTPLFRGYVKRVKETLQYVEIFAQDALGYLKLGGDSTKAMVPLTDRNNIDGLTVGNAIRKAISIAQLSDKIGTDCIGDTTPLISSSRPPLRGTLSLEDIIKQLLGKAIDDSGLVPRPNIGKLIDDGNKSQFVIELESDLKTTDPVMTFNEYDNITSLKIINKKIPTIIVVNGANDVKAQFSHEGAIEAYDKTYLEVTNEKLKSPAECKDFAQKLFRANLETQYEYGIDSFDGVYLEENEVVNIRTDDPEFSGNYRVRGKKIAFTPGGFSIGININRKPPTLAEYIKQQDN